MERGKDDHIKAVTVEWESWGGGHNQFKLFFLPGREVAPAILAPRLTMEPAPTQSPRFKQL